MPHKEQRLQSISRCTEWVTRTADQWTGGRRVFSSVKVKGSCAQLLTREAWFIWQRFFLAYVHWFGAYQTYKRRIARWGNLKQKLALSLLLQFVKAVKVVCQLLSNRNVYSSWSLCSLWDVWLKKKARQLEVRKLYKLCRLWMKYSFNQITRDALTWNPNIPWELHSIC